MSKHPSHKVLEAIAEPALVGAYRNAVSLVCRPGYVKVSKSQHKKFLERQKQLDAAGFTYDRYAYTVIKTWWSWCRGKSMKVVPVNIFCGAKAWEGFLKDMESTVRLDTAAEEDVSKLVHEEMTAAIYFLGAQLGGTVTGMSHVRETLKYADPPLDKVRAEAMSLLNELYETNATDYNDLARQLVMRRRVMTQVAQRVHSGNHTH